jgi:hypothetical protein
MKGVYQPTSFKNTAFTFGIEQQRHKLKDEDQASLELKNTRFVIGIVTTFGGPSSAKAMLRPLAPTLDPLRASVYSEMADSVKYDSVEN